MLRPRPGRGSTPRGRGYSWCRCCSWRRRRCRSWRNCWSGSRRWCRPRWGAISSASIQIRAWVVQPTPHDHLGTSPHCRVIFSSQGWIRSASRHPAVCPGFVSATSIQVRCEKDSTPDDHFTPVPNGRMRVSRRGRVAEARGCPTVRVWVVSAAGVRVVERFIDAAQTIISLSVHTAV
jgi:hypothetical protein